MKVILIAAGRGQRLMPTTVDTPKCFAEVAGQRLLDWSIDAFHANGLLDIHFIGGYQIGKVKEAYPQLSFRENSNWEHTNMLASLFCAEDLMDEPFICCYSDVLFTPDIISRLIANAGGMVLGVDTAWLERYTERTEHPPDDAEKVIVADGLVRRIHRQIPEADAHGEYIGVSKFSTAGAACLRKHYQRCRTQFAGKPWREAAVFEKAYKILLFQEMIEAGEEFSYEETPGGYVEVDTQQDFEYARKHWLSSHIRK